MLFLQLFSVNVCLCVCVPDTARMYKKHMDTWSMGVWCKGKIKKKQNLHEYFHITYHIGISLTKKASENRTIWIWQKAMVEMLAFSFWPWSWVRRGQTSDWPLEEFSGLSIHSGDCVTWLHVMMASSWCAVSWWSYSVHSHQSPRHPNIPLEGSWVN